MPFPSDIISLYKQAQISLTTSYFIMQWWLLNKAQDKIANLSFLVRDITKNICSDLIILKMSHLRKLKFVCVKTRHNNSILFFNWLILKKIIRKTKLMIFTDYIRISHHQAIWKNRFQLLVGSNLADSNLHGIVA